MKTGHHELTLMCSVGPDTEIGASAVRAILESATPLARQTAADRLVQAVLDDDAWRTEVMRLLVDSMRPQIDEQAEVLNTHISDVFKAAQEELEPKLKLNESIIADLMDAAIDQYLKKPNKVYELICRVIDKNEEISKRIRDAVEEKLQQGIGASFGMYIERIMKTETPKTDAKVAQALKSLVSRLISEAK